MSAPAAAANGRFALRDYLVSTRERLNVPGFAPSAEELKSKIMPTVTGNVRTKSTGAPQKVRDAFKAAFFDAGVLPNFEADFAAFKGSIELCLDALRDAGIEGIPPKKEVVEEPAEVGDDDDDDIFAMMGGMGDGDDRYAANRKEEAKEEAADGGDEDDVFAMMGGMGEGDPNFKVSDGVTAEQAEEASPAKKGREELIATIDGFLDKLDENPPPPQVLKSKAMPQIVNTIKAKTAAAPQETRLKFKAILEENGVLPDFECGFEDLKQALIQIQVALR